jgi:hypothetical protein
MPAAKFSTVKGADLRAWLDAHNATVEQFAVASGYSYQHVFKLLSGAYDEKMPYGVSNTMELIEAKPEVLTRKEPWQPTVVAKPRKHVEAEESLSVAQ